MGMRTRPVGLDSLLLTGGEDKVFQMNDWSFGQLCRLAGVTKETVNRLSSDTASRVFGETLPSGNKPLQVFAVDDLARSIHGPSYIRLHNTELLDIVLDCADGFEPPPKGFNGGTGLYCGEQDMFCFLIDPTGWTDNGGGEPTQCARANMNSTGASAAAQAGCGDSNPAVLGRTGYEFLLVG